MVFQKNMQLPDLQSNFTGLVIFQFFDDAFDSQSPNTSLRFSIRQILMTVIAYLI